MSGNSISRRPWLEGSEFNENPGLSIYWIIQLVFIEPLKKFLSDQNFILPENIKASFGGFEPAGKYLTYEKKETEILLNGKKGFITGAFESDWIFLSARKPGGEKISALIAVRNEGVIKDSLKDLNLQALKKTSHASLIADNIYLDNAILAENNSPALRRIIKSGNIMERILILEASGYFAGSISNQINNLDLTDKIAILSDKIKAATDNSFEVFKLGGKIYETLDLKLEMSSLFSEIESIIESNSQPAKFKEYLADISFLRKFLLT